MRLALIVVVGSAAACLAAGCGREPTRDASPPAGAPPDAVRQLDFVAGPATPAAASENPYAGDAHALAEGQRMYGWMNCSGCHFAGGGGIGPPLMDDDWIYGGRADQIFDSIASGRANGMPAYGDRLSTDQLWHIVAYVQQLSADTEARAPTDASGEAGPDAQ